LKRGLALFGVWKMRVHRIGCRRPHQAEPARSSAVLRWLFWLAPIVPAIVSYPRCPGQPAGAPRIPLVSGAPGHLKGCGGYPASSGGAGTPSCERPGRSRSLFVRGGAQQIPDVDGTDL
jgi:hypothetical protein